MRMIAAAAFATAAFFVPALASAQDAPAPSAVSAATGPAAAAAASAPTMADGNGVNLDEIVCKTSPPTTGSRLGGGHECHTVREWNQRQLDSQNALMHQQQKGYAPTRRGG